MSRRGYTLDVNPTSASRVKVRCYESRPVESGGNILLLQGQLSVKQFQALERVFRAGAAAEGVEISVAGRYYGLAPARGAQSGHARCAHRDESRSAAARGASSRRSHIRLVEDTQPRAPGVRGPVIGPHGVVEDGDDYDALAHRHVERLLRRRREAAGSGL